MRKTACFTLLFVFLSVAGAVAEASFSIRKTPGANVPQAYKILPGGMETELDNQIFPAEMPLRETTPLPEYWYLPVALGPDQPEGVFLGDADTGLGRFIPLSGGRWCKSALISPDGKLVALFLETEEQMDVVFCDLESGQTIRTLPHASPEGWVDARRMVVNQYDLERSRYRPEGSIRYIDSWCSVAVCEVTSQKVGQPWIMLRATETDDYSVGSLLGALSLVRASVPASGEMEQRHHMEVPLAFAEKAWVTGEACGIRDKGPASGTSLDRIWEPYILQDSGEELAYPVDVEIVHMPVLPVPEGKPQYAWFAMEPGMMRKANGKPGVWLAIPDFGPGVFLPLREASSCTAVWISPDEKRVLLSLQADEETLPSLGIYDINAQRLTDVLPASGYPAWVNEDRFAFVVSNSQKSPLVRSENTNLWESVALCEIGQNGLAETRTLFQATETENYFLMQADWNTSELVIWQSFVRDLAGWKNDIRGKEIRVPFPVRP